MIINLLDLFVKIAVNDEASDKVKTIAGNIGNGLKTAAKIGTAAIGAAVTGITALTSASVKQYAEYEQLVGGVETLFKDSSDKVKKYAQEAYKNSSMSVNEYLDTATSFAASLINSFKDTSGTITEAMANDMIESLDKQVDAFENATDAQIKLINKQYTENLKLIDEEEYRRVKAIDDEIAAIEAEEKAEEKVIKERQRQEHLAELEKQLSLAVTIEKQKELKDEIARYTRELAELEKKELRQDELEKLKMEKSAIQDEFDARRESLKEQQNIELDSYKETRDKELEYLKARLKDQEKAIKASIGSTSEAMSLPATAYANAAEIADMAIRDMSDNSAKMGSNLESIKTAYMGFSKQQFQLLDNLKLGYGGSKTEMERLLKDAEAISGISYDISSYADIVEAIHVIQEEMGIAGTTAKEAGTTIQGSFGMLKAAWGNLLTGMADKNADFESLVNDLVTSIVGDGTENNLGVFGNLAPRIEIALGGVVKVVEGIFPKLVEMLPGLIGTTLPAVLNGAILIIQTLVSTLDENKEEIVPVAFSLIMLLVSSIFDLLPQVLKVGMALLIEVARGIASALPELLPALVLVIREIAHILTNPDSVRELTGAALDIIVALAEGLGDAIPELIDIIALIIENIVIMLLDPQNTAKIINAAAKIIIALGSGIVAAIPRLLSSIITLIDRVIQNFTDTDWEKTGRTIIDGLLGGLKSAWTRITDWATSAWNSVTDIFSNWFSDEDDKKKKKKGSNAGGLSYVPRSGNLYELHQGEMVLTANEAREYRRNQQMYAPQPVNNTPVQVVMQVDKTTFGRLVFNLNGEQTYINGMTAVEAL